MSASVAEKIEVGAAWIQAHNNKSVWYNKSGDAWHTKIYNDLINSCYSDLNVDHGCYTVIIPADQSITGEEIEFTF